MTMRAVRMLEEDTQAQVAKKLGLSTQTYAHYERNPEQMKIKTLLRFCDLYGIRITDLKIFNGG